MKSSLARLVFFTTCASFFSFGIYNSGLGPVLFELAHRTGSSLASVGVIFTAIYAGSLTSQFASGWLTTKFGRINIMTISIFLMAIGIMGLVNVYSLILLVVSCFVIGLGQGGVDMVSNLLVTQAYPKRSVAALNILHILFGVGATIGPALVSLAMRWFDRGLLIEWMAALMFSFLGIMFLFIRKNYSMEISSSKPFQFPENEQLPLFKNPLVWMLGLLLLLVVGTQFSLGSWASVFMTRTAGVTPEKASLIASLFWLFMSIGRVLAIFLSKFLVQKKMLFVHIIGSLIGTICFVIFTGDYVPSVISLLFISLSFGGMYPLLLSFVPKFFIKNVDKANSVIVFLGTVGGLIVPTLTGIALNSISPSAYTWTILLFIVSLLGLSILLKRSYVQKS